MMKIVKSTLAAALAVTAFAPSAQAEGTWADKFTLGADLRYRIQDEKRTPIGGDEQANTKQRFRLRLAGNAKINEQWSGGLRFATSSAINSRDQDMTDFHGPKFLGLDRAFMKYSASESTSALFGKLPTMFWAAGGNQLIWNQNISQEGVELNHSFTVGDMKPSVNLAYHTLSDTGFVSSTQRPDVNMFGAQLLVPYKSEAMNVTLGLGSYTYSNIANLPVTSFGSTNESTFGNNKTGTGTAARFANDFALMNAGLEVAMTTSRGPITLFADYTQNSKAEKDEGNTAIISGVVFGKASAPGSWQLGVHYRDVAADAVFGPITDSGFLTGTTDLYGTGVDVSYGLADNVILTAAYQTGAHTTYEKHQRMQIQLDAKF